MKKMKSIISVILAVALVASLGVVSFAATHNVNNTLTNVTSSNAATTFDNAGPTNYIATLTPAAGYRLPDDVKVEVNSIDKTDDYYLDGEIEIPFADVDGDIVITADAVKTVTLNYAEGAQTATMPASVTKDSGEDFTVSTTIPTTAGAFVFTGWNDGTDPVAPGATITNVTDDITLTAQWVASVNATFKSGGYGADKVVKVDSGVSFALPTEVEIGFTRSGYEISGWKIGSATTATPVGTAQSITASTIYTAVWTKVSSGSGNGNDAPPSNSGSGSGSSSSVSNSTFWSNTLSDVKAAKTGSTVKIDMTGRGSMPSEILTAINAKDITLSVTNGTQSLKINGKTLQLDGSTSYSFNKLLSIYAPAATLPTPPVNPGTGARA